VTSPAQTNIQLFNQLAECAYSMTEIEYVRDSYVFAMPLFSGQYRPSGKTFIAHAVGTASVLATFRAPAHLLAAAILHSAYTLGVWGTLRRSIDERKRNRLRKAIGFEAEFLVHAYASFEWNEHQVRRLLESKSPLSARERDVVMIRLANEVDEYAELAGLYAPSWEGRVAAARSLLPACIELAERIGASRLGDEIRFVSEQTLSQPWPRAMTTRSPASILVPPASHIARPHVLARTFADGLRAKFRSI
jgi:(p)ppGpp synthase/HD superfamily hydrolase